MQGHATQKNSYKRLENEDLNLLVSRTHPYSQVIILFKYLY